MMTTDQASTDRARRTAFGLSGVAVVSILFVFTSSNDAFRLIKIAPAALVILLVVGALGALGAQLGRPPLYLAASVLALAAAVLQFAQLGTTANWVGGNGSTMSLLAGLGFGFGALWYALRPVR